ncbi:MAG: hypothetical protein JWN67_2079 [Actinomycetia bacterium]|nr:hypothetical protein [Actinomycetes bacterium]
MAGFTFDAELWISDTHRSVHFVSLPEPVADEIDELFGHVAKGFGSQKVEVTVGRTTWSTSIFPSEQSGTYVLPVKQAVRKAEGLEAGSTARVTLVVVP